MKLFTRLIAMLLAVLMLTACSAKTPASTAASTAEKPETTPVTTAAPETTAPDPWEALGSDGKVGTVLPDFTVTTAAGENFTLSEALKSHELVFINLWATWCNPCSMEFPFLQDAYAEYGDRVAVIALSVEENDTAKIMQEFAQKRQLSFPMAQDEGFRLTKAFYVTSIPTSLLVNQSREVLWMETGAKTSKAAFTQLFDQYLNQP